MAVGVPKRQWPPLNLLPEISQAVLQRLFGPLRSAWRRSLLYRSSLKGRMADRIVFHPYDPLPRRLGDADAALRGRFRFDGDAVDVREGSVFDKSAPSAAWAKALHGFDWLPPLSSAGGDAARVLATNLIAQWIKRNARYSEPAWLPEVTARRINHLLAHGHFVVTSSDMLWRSRLFVSLREQSRVLARTIDEAPEGLPRLEAATANVLCAACLNESAKRLEAGLKHLEREIGHQILPDGGHISRSPEDLLHAYRHVVMAMDALQAIEQPVPNGIRSAHDRMAPMLRFFRHGDGGLALFNGGSEGDAPMIAALLARDDVRGQPFLHAPHSGFQRLVGTRSLAVMDCGPPPKGAPSVEAHAGCLSFEFSAGNQRIVVNCGGEGAAPVRWDGALRATAAHSTVTLADTSMAAVLAPGLAREMLGPRLLGGPLHVETSRQDTPQGWRVVASHDGYAHDFGTVHERTLMLAHNGSALTGSDKLVPRGKAMRKAISFAARFHIHPDVRVSPSQSSGFILKLPSGEGWRFRCSGGEVAIEESIYLGNGVVRRTEQIVLTGTVKDAPVELAWLFEQMGGV
jgi:uncharacterized heparinase superfamily protein